jgi:hypothetical protein
MDSGGNGGQTVADEGLDAQGPWHGRRSFLRVGLLGGGAAVAMGAGGIGAAYAMAPAANATVAATAARRPPFQLFAQSDLNFETLFTLGSAGYGCSEVGEIVTTVNRINARGASYQTYYDSFLAMARNVDALAGRELAAGHKASALSA